MTTSRSQNGWLTHPGTSDLYRFTAAGENWWAPGPHVATVAAEFINFWDEDIEPVKGGQLDDWSWAGRPVRGWPLVISNHASATAWDINALRHPLGKLTLTPAKLMLIRRKLATIVDKRGLPVLRSGAFYSNRKDQMHFEVNATQARVQEASLIIRARPGYKSVKA